MGVERRARARQCVKVLVVLGFLFCFSEPPGSCQGWSMNGDASVEKYGQEAQLGESCDESWQERMRAWPRTRQ